MLWLVTNLLQLFRSAAIGSAAFFQSIDVN